MRLHAALVNDEYKDIPGVLVNGWSGSWKKFLFSLMYHNDWYLLYPGYKQVGAWGGGGVGTRVQAGCRVQAWSGQNRHRSREPTDISVPIRFLVVDVHHMCRSMLRRLARLEFTPSADAYSSAVVL